MAVFVRVDHSKFENTARSIESYISTQNSNMNNANSKVADLSSTWSGQDYMGFKFQWEKCFNSDSTSKKMASALQNYANFLRYAANQYKDAQASAVNRANWLRW